MYNCTLRLRVEVEDFLEVNSVKIDENWCKFFRCWLFRSFYDKSVRVRTEAEVHFTTAQLSPLLLEGSMFLAK